MINDIFIIYYFFIGLLGLFVGQFMDWANSRLEKHKRVLSLDFFKEYLPNMRVNAKLIYPMALIYVGLLYRFGWSINLVKYMILSPMFIGVFVIDYRKQIIPNRLSLTIFEVGLIFAFISGLSSFNVFIDKILGMLVGGGIFLLITWVGGLIAGKEAMGFGDVKLMAGLGMIFGLVDIIMIAVLSFLVGAILSIILLIVKRKKGSEYIPFGPFIILATFAVMVVPYNAMMTFLLKVFTLGMFNS